MSHLHKLGQRDNIKMDLLPEYYFTQYFKLKTQ